MPLRGDRVIYARLEDASDYIGINPRLDRALSMLMPETVASVGRETQRIEGDALYVTRFDVETSADEARLFEYHRQYIDIFTLVEGCERVDIACPDALELQAQSGDCWNCSGDAKESLVLRPGHFLVLFPGEAHRPGMTAGEAGKVGRIVFKILYKEK